MTRRVQGGTEGLLAALASGRLDPLDAALLEEWRVRPITTTERRALDRRARRRAKWLAKRLPF